MRHQISARERERERERESKRVMLSPGDREGGRERRRERQKQTWPSDDMHFKVKVRATKNKHEARRGEEERNIRS